MTRTAFGERATAANHDAPLDPPDTEDSILATTHGDVLLPILLDYINNYMSGHEALKLESFVERHVAKGRAS